MNNCKLEFDCEIFTEKFCDLQLQMKFFRFQFFKPIKIFDFAQIESINEESKFDSQKFFSNYELKIENCKISICSSIPKYISSLKFSKCQIVISDDFFFENTKNLSAFTNQIEEHSQKIQNKKMNIIIGNYENLIFDVVNCVLPDNLLISGIFRTINLTDSVTNKIFINSNYQFLEIQNQKGEVTISSIIQKAIFGGEYSYINIRSNENTIFLDNLHIDVISNLDVDRIDIENCQIQNIDNVSGAYIKILNTKCSFQIMNTNEMKKYSGMLQNFTASKSTLKKYQF